MVGKQGGEIHMGERTAAVVSIVVEANDDGYLASVSGVQGAFAEGDTLEEVVFNCVDVLGRGRLMPDS
jgi:hypothetical protein